MSDFGRELTRLMDERGTGVRQLARAVYVNAAHVSNLRNGKARPSHKLAALIDGHLQAGGALEAAAQVDLERAGKPGQPLGREVPVVADMADVTRADLADMPARTAPAPAAFMTTLSSWDEVADPACPPVLSAGQAGPREIEHLEEAARLFRTWDHEHGGGLGRKAAAGQLAEVAALLARPHPAPLRRRLLGVASQLALTIASMAADSGHTLSAYRYLRLSLEAAREARDATLGARAANAIARRVLEDGDPHTALSLLQHARQSLRDLPAEMTALLCTTQAWTCAALGDYEQMAPCLEQAAANAGGPGSLFGTAELAGMAGACHEALAARSNPPHRATHIARAAAHITDALRLRDGYYARSRVLDLAGLANVRLLQGEPEEAAQAGTQAIDAATALRSDRAARRVHTLAIRALDQYPGVPAVADLADAVRSRLPIALSPSARRDHAVDGARTPDHLRQPVDQPRPGRRRAARRQALRAARRPHGPPRLRHRHHPRWQGTADVAPPPRH